jgi:hypothetical protein
VGHGGRATIVTRGNLLAGDVRVTYDRFTDDGATFIDGTMAAQMADRTSRFRFDVRVSGAPPLPPLGACYDKLPVAVPLRAVSDGRLRPGSAPAHRARCAPRDGYRGGDTSVPVAVAK